MEVAVGLKGSKVIGVLRGDGHEISPHGGVVELEGEGGDIVDCIQGLINGDVANSVSGIAELETLSQSFGTINEAKGFSLIRILLLESLLGVDAESVLLTERVASRNGEGEAVVDPGVSVGEREGCAQGGNENDCFVHLYYLLF